VCAIRFSCGVVAYYVMLAYGMRALAQGMLCGLVCYTNLFCIGHVNAGQDLIIRIVLCPTAISPLHPSYGIPTNKFALYLLFPVAAGTCAGMVFLTRSRRQEVAGGGILWRCAFLLQSLVMSAAVFVSLCFTVELLEGGSLQVFVCVHVYVPGFMHESLMQHLQTQWRVDTTRREYEARKALSDGRPRVVLMIPSRPNLHPGTHGKQSESCMHVWQALRFCMWRV
jgi:hypothetical protein